MNSGTASDAADGVDGTDCASGYSKMWIDQDKFTGLGPQQVDADSVKGPPSLGVERTNETTMQVAYTTPSSGWVGGFTGSSTQSSSISWKPSVANDAWKVFKIHWEYQRQRAECVYFEPETGYTSICWLNHWRWSPTRVTGNKLLDTQSAVTCGSGARYRDTFGAETSIAPGGVVTFSGWFTVAGVKLDARSADGDYEKFSIWPNANTNVTACGNNDEPLYADLVQEVN